MQLQGDLLQEPRIFGSMEWGEQLQACRGLQNWSHGPEPLRLLFILNKLSKIGESTKV